MLKTWNLSSCQLKNIKMPEAACHFVKQNSLFCRELLKNERVEIFTSVPNAILSFCKKSFFLLFIKIFKNS